MSEDIYILLQQTPYYSVQRATTARIGKSEILQTAILNVPSNFIFEAEADRITISYLEGVPKSCRPEQAHRVRHGLLYVPKAKLPGQCADVMLSQQPEDEEARK